MVTTTGARHSINMISAVTAQGALRFAVYDGNLTAVVFIDFFKRLLHDAAANGAGPVYLVVDGHPGAPGHGHQAIRRLHQGRLRLVFLPGYSPEPRR